MNFLKQQILRLKWRRQKLALEARFQPCPTRRGGNLLQNLAENTPELFLKVLDFTENKEILTACCGPCKRHHVGRLLRNKFPQDFKSKEDIKAKFEWLHEYEPKDIHAIAKMFLRSKEKNDNTIGEKRKRDEEEEIEFQSKALKCFYYWTKGWSKVLKGHTRSVRSVIKLNETTVVSGSDDGTLRVWDLTNDTSRVLTGHTVG